MGYRGLAWLGVAVGCAILAGGCALTQKHKESQKTSKLETKIEKLNRKVRSLQRENGSLMARMQQLDEEVTLLEDKISGTQSLVERAIQGRAPRRGHKKEYRVGRRDSRSIDSNRGIELSDVQSRTAGRSRNNSEEQSSRESTDDSGSGGSSSSEVTSASESRPEQKTEPDKKSVTITQEDYEQKWKGADEEPTITTSEPEPSNDEPSESGSNKEDSAITPPPKGEMFGEQNNNDSAPSPSNNAKGGHAKPQTQDASAAESAEVSTAPEQNKDNSEANAASVDAPAPDQSATEKDSSTDKQNSTSEQNKEDEPVDFRQFKVAQKVYEHARDLYLDRKFERAKSAFKHFLSRDPSADYVDNAWYWIGECLYGMKRYGEAISTFKKIRREFPSGNKVPAALVKMALAYRQKGQPKIAKQKLQIVVNDYSEAPAAKRARKFLDSDDPNT